MGYRKGIDHLRMVLSMPSSEDQQVDNLVSVVAPHVWWAIGVDVQDLSDEQIETLRDNLHHVLHWAIHVGQSAWEILNVHSEMPTPGSIDPKWNIALYELYFRPFIMLHTDRMFGDLMRATDWFRQPLVAKPAQHRRWSRNASFTRRRLELARDSSIQPQIVEDATYSAFAEVTSRLYATAKLYIEFLEWLVSAPKRSKIEISDCFVNICALALEMSGHALRLQWPI